ncbi:hypothetical protein HBH56_204510 [Parastagonospora nodorum]|uniref:Uncharacterized protein n=1 Tax=Phaeosphaeria nodorum (strain SN15 / ATCC MYA-4574 / FGSC 10173) TaxID=321614 RepID=A0A7U2FAL5_PHANO|nr:hypothetical protein HBH56_204510 [Parastagonospora nodorum]QRD01662.1 hypothetical protein JI435_145910 [Parastagonospora nodorum SN15]KAH3923913.1 hypothetical protein HBH54_203390 [Parastagonospora nodorum]KAH3941391.1 hypothetical protein HBH53_200930 [Parastagonospora nodorum]KAH3959551.1 hypothetical protein HBH51_199610 [Parastagonospora nodorum]
MFSSKYAYNTPPAPQEMPTTAFGMTGVQQKMRGVTLEDGFETPPPATSTSWTADKAKFARFESLKEMTLGTCRLLYGSERFRFYDIVIGADEGETTFCAALVLSKDGSTKILRTSCSDCPIKATQIIVSQLHKDVFPLLVNLGAGAQLQGQQGYTNGLTGTFELADNKKNTKPDGAADDTETLAGRGGDSWVPNAPRGPKHSRGGFKRPRRSENEGQVSEQMGDSGMDGGLNYD